MHRRSLTKCLFCLLITLLATFAFADEPARRPVAVTFSAVGPEGDAVDATLVEGFVDSLNARPGFAAKATPRSGAYWMTPPKSADARLSFVGVGVGEHRDLLALIWDDKATTVLAAAHRQCRVGVKARRDWLGPGPNQIPDNAIKELAADVGHAWLPALTRRDDRRVQVNVVSWNVTAADLTGGIDAMVKDKKAAEPERPVAATGAAIDAVKAITFAALAEAGFQASSEAAPITLNIEVAQATDHYAFRVTLTSDGKSTKYQRRFVPRPDLYDHLLTVSRKMLLWHANVRDAARLGIGAASPLASVKGLVIASVGGDLRGIDSLTGDDKWIIEAPPKSTPRYQASATPGAPNGVMGFLRASEQIDLQTGKPTLLATVVPVLPFALDVMGDRVAVMRDTVVTLNQSGRELWKITFPEPLACGPGLAGDVVVVGNDAGELIGLAAADGKELWRKPTQIRPRGPITLIEDRLIVGSVEGTLLAISPKDGSILWRHAARDLPLDRPRLIDGLLLVADKGNTLWLLNPKTGAPSASFTAPTWLRGVAVAENAGKKWIACCDLRGVVRFLSVPDLKPVREVDLKTSPTGAMIFAPDFPLTWASHDDLEQKSAGLLVGAEDGWIYLVELPE